MINEDKLWFKRGDLVEFKLNLGGGPKTCKGLVLNTAVLFGRGARQIWILHIKDASAEQEKYWTNRKHIVHEEDIISSVPSIVIGADTILRDNPISYPVRDAEGEKEFQAITLTIAAPTSTTQ